MQQRNLFIVSLIISLLGILFLLLLTNLIELKQTNIEEINNNLLNQKIKIQGIISKITDKKTFQILSISDSTGKIDVLCECKNNKFQVNNTILVSGTVQDYKKNFQISADKIIKIK